MSEGIGTVSGGVDTRGRIDGTLCRDVDDDICFAGVLLKTGFRLGDFIDSLVIVNVLNFLIELRAASPEVLVGSVNIVRVSLEGATHQRK